MNPVQGFKAMDEERIGEFGVVDEFPIARRW